MSTPSRPVWLLPADPGNLSNTNGSDTSTHALPLKLRYSNPASQGDTVGAMRVIASRVKANGVPQQPVVVWDPGWVGGVTTQALPAALDSFGYAIWASGALDTGVRRIYITGGQTYGGTAQNAVWSAPFVGGNIGAWRPETPMPAFCVGHVTVAIDGYLYVLSGMQQRNPFYRSSVSVVTSCWVAPIDGNGKVGGWSSSLPLPAGRVYGAAIQAGVVGDPARADFGRPLLVFTGGSNLSGSGVAQANTYVTTINADGSFEGWVNGTNLATAVFGHFLYWEPGGSMLWCLGGINSSGAAVATVQATTWSIVALTMGAWGVQAGSALPAARAGAMGYYTAQWDGIGQGRVLLWGGTSNNSLPSTTGIYSTLIYSFTPVGVAGLPLSWNSVTPTDLGPSGVPTGLIPRCCGGGVAIQEATGDGTSFGEIQVAFFGGRANGFNDILETYSTSSLAGNPANGFSVFYWGWNQAPLTLGQLGTGAAAATNQDGTIGTVDITFLYGAYGLGTAGALNDGDEILLSAQFVDNVGGDPSPISYTTIRIGQPPIVSSPSPAGTITTGQPTASFTYTAGPGGGPQATWRLVVTDSFGALVFDSGLRPDQLNSVLVGVAPLLKSGTTYTFRLTVVSSDTPVPGSTATAVATTSVTPSYTAPLPPY